MLERQSLSWIKQRRVIPASGGAVTTNVSGVCTPPQLPTTAFLVTKRGALPELGLSEHLTHAF